MPTTRAAMRERAGLAASNGAPLIRRRLGDIMYDSFFQYGINFAHTVGTEAFTGNIPIQADAHFLCVESVYDLALTVVPAYALANLGVTPQVAAGGTLVQLTDGGSQRLLSNQQVPASNLFGSAQRPFVWPFTHLFRANSFIGILSTGIAAAQMAGVTVRYTFCGFKVPVGSVPELGL